MGLMPFVNVLPVRHTSSNTVNFLLCPQGAYLFQACLRGVNGEKRLNKLRKTPGGGVVVIMKNYLAIELWFLLCKSLSREGCSLEFLSTRMRILGEGLVVPSGYIAFSKNSENVSGLHKELEIEHCI